MNPLNGSWWASFMKRYTGRYGGEIIVHWWLKSHHIPHQEQVKFVLPFRASNSNYVYADFLLDYKSCKVWIEYNGEQHYQMVEAYHRYESDFRKHQRRDQAVCDYCEQQGYYEDWELRSKMLRTADIFGNTVKSNGSRHYRLGEIS